MKTHYNPQSPTCSESSILEGECLSLPHELGFKEAVGRLFQTLLDGSIVSPLLTRRGLHQIRTESGNVGKHQGEEPAIEALL